MRLNVFWSVAILWFLVDTRCVAFEEKDMVCNDSFCKKYVEANGCPELSEACLVQNSTHNGVRLPYPKLCNCCAYCITNLEYDEVCDTGSPGMPPPSAICGPRLTCERKSNGLASTCQYMKTACMLKQNDWDDRRNKGTLGMMELRPKCDDDGDFSPAHCIPGSLCYCLTPNGNRIFGELPFLSPSDEYKMSCGCSLNSWKMLQSIHKDVRDFALAARCNDYGLYDSLQCMTGGDDPYCFCVNPVTGDPRSDAKPVRLSELKSGSPSCFDPAIHFPPYYESDCERALRTWQENLKRSSTMYDFEEPKCDPDGKFGRVQKLDERFVCVDPFGELIDNYGSPVDSADAKTINCNCARTVYVLKNASVAELPSCDSRGNFLPLQSHRNQYFCVDCNGDQTVKEVDSDKADTLSCLYVDEPCASSS